MSVRVMSWVFGLEKLAAMPKIVLLAIADCANDEGVAWPGHDLLARKSSCSVRTLIRQIDFLVAQGLLSKQVRNSAAGRRSNVYVVNTGREYVPVPMPGAGAPAPQDCGVPGEEGCESRTESTTPKPVDNSMDGKNPPVDNFGGGKGQTPTFPRKTSQVPNCHLGCSPQSPSDTGGTCPSDTGVTWLYIEPSLEPSPSLSNLNQVGAVDNFGGGAAAGGGENTRSAAVPGAKPGGGGVPGADRDLLRAVLPGPMLGVLNRDTARKITVLLAQARSRGLDLGAVRSRLEASGSISGAFNPGGLVLYRVKTALSAPLPLKPVDGDEFLRQAAAEAEKILDGDCGRSFTGRRLFVNGLLNSRVFLSAYPALAERLYAWDVSASEAAQAAEEKAAAGAAAARARVLNGEVFRAAKEKMDRALEAAK